jgi:hypothetical protein
MGLQVCVVTLPASQALEATPACLPMHCKRFAAENKYHSRRGTLMTELDAIDFFTDLSVVNDPSPYLDHLRAKCPAFRETHHGAMMVTGYAEAMEVFANTAKSSPRAWP